MRAAKNLGLESRVLESRLAYDSNWLARHFNWRLRSRRPTHLADFGRLVLRNVADWNPHLVLAVGAAPLPAKVLRSIRLSNVCTANYSTDDPWNGHRKGSWLFASLREYDMVLSTRTSNLDDLRRLGCRSVQHVPFGYDPVISFPDPPVMVQREGENPAELLFVGGGDPDRYPYMLAAVQAGLDLSIYGDYWRRVAKLRPFARGHADPSAIRRATSSARVAVCLVRRANRDGHVMRTFEIPASGGCMVVEATREHKALFGPEGNAVLYFSTPTEMVEKTRILLSNPNTASRLREKAHEIVVNGAHKYQDRLTTILKQVETHCGQAKSPQTNSNAWYLEQTSEGR